MTFGMFLVEHINESRDPAKDTNLIGLRIFVNQLPPLPSLPSSPSPSLQGFHPSTMHTLRRAPHKSPPITHLCTHCRHASTKTAPKTAQTRLLLKSTARDLAERSAILRERVHSARRARREDWLLGPLAPDRAAADPDYGCVSTRELKGVAGLKRTRQGRSPYMIGRGEEWSWGESLVEVGDTVVVVAERGAGWRERGRVGRVSEVRKGVGECVIEEMNLVSLCFDGYLLI